MTNQRMARAAAAMWLGLLAADETMHWGLPQWAGLPVWLFTLFAVGNCAFLATRKS
jgi:hypothetical protein